MKKQHDVITFKKLHQWVKEKKIYLDTAFQRKGGWDKGSGWEKANFSKYILSILSGVYANSITVARIQESVKFFYENGIAAHNGESIKYFENLANLGYKYLSIDGWNTTSCVYHFIEGNFPITINGEELYFQDLKEIQQQIIQNSQIPILYIEGANKEQVTLLFRLMNSSTALLDQERRQARFTDFASSIRKLGDQLGSVFYNWSYNKKDDLDKRMHEESIAVWIQARNRNFNSMRGTDLDNLYETRKNLAENEQKNLDSVSEILIKISNATGKCPSNKNEGYMTTRGGLITLAIIIEEMMSTHQIVSGKEKYFYDYFIDSWRQFKKWSQDEEDCSNYKKWLSAFHAGYGERVLDLNKEFFHNVGVHALLKSGIIETKQLELVENKSEEELCLVPDTKLMVQSDRQKLKKLWNKYADKYNKLHGQQNKDSNNANVEEAAA